MSRRGRRKGSLSTSGALAAFLVGAVHMFCGLQYGLTLIFFYLSSSKLTRLGAKRKATIEEGHKDGGSRNAVQVLANSLAACVFAELAYMLAWRGGVQRMTRVLVAGAFLGHYACCCGDTWASELGVLSRSPPRLITSGRKVPPGTNGGVTLLGLACSVAGGLAVSLAFFVAGAAGCALGAAPRGGTLCTSLSSPAGGVAAGSGIIGWGTWGPADLLPLATVGLVCGLGGSLLDSVLGATLQYTGWDARTQRVLGKGRPRRAGGVDGDIMAGKGDHGTAAVVHISGLPVLSNDAVNFLSASVSAVMGAALLAHLTVA